MFINLLFQYIGLFPLLAVTAFTRFAYVECRSLLFFALESLPFIQGHFTGSLWFFFLGSFLGVLRSSAEISKIPITTDIQNFLLMSEHLGYNLHISSSYICVHLHCCASLFLTHFTRTFTYHFLSSATINIIFLYYSARWNSDLCTGDGSHCSWVSMPRKETP